ncbi:MAG TPA: lysophospholipid acyltransferase family protein [Gemmatimonadales bacterium]|nr:lysophospholipid acyltransferase family protein [Gemmatimonadales bacterium]
MKPRWAEPFVAAVGFALVGVLARTWRYRLVHRERAQALYDARRPFIFALWHNRILPLLYAHRHEGMVLLISRHRDGGYLATLAERWGYHFVRGSSQRGGEVGLLGVVRALKGGNVVAVTPDGPRGPVERVKPGVVAAAQHAGVPIIPATARVSRSWTLGSWDRFAIPKPFATIDVVYGVPLEVASGKEGMRAGVAAVEAELLALSQAS